MTASNPASIKLHIGGKEPHPEWKILDVEPRPEVDFIGNASDLSQFPDNSVAAIYASHVLEHFYFGINKEVLTTLTEWHRVLQSGGQLYLSVPDLRVLCWLYLRPMISPMERFQVMAMMFGGQINEYDVHKVGFDIDFLTAYLEAAGFKEYRQVSELGLFNDTSSMRVMNTLISLNILATK